MQNWHCRETSINELNFKAPTEENKECKQPSGKVLSIKDRYKGDARLTSSPSEKVHQVNLDDHDEPSKTKNNSQINSEESRRKSETERIISENRETIHNQDS